MLAQSFGTLLVGLDSSTLMPNSHQEPFARLFNDTFPLPLEAGSSLGRTKFVRGFV
jgi:hypothetical protein